MYVPYKFPYKYIFFIQSNYVLQCPGEIRGKASNVNWAVRQMMLNSTQKEIERMIVTILDADTCLTQDYFMTMNYHFGVAGTKERRESLMFAPLTVFDR
jgi:cellulose synthase/poly-beta-1,6-N-acetylglucosamine synthase-like glycosyltransferase